MTAVRWRVAVAVVAFVLLMGGALLSAGRDGAGLVVAGYLLGVATLIARDWAWRDGQEDPS